MQAARRAALRFRPAVWLVAIAVAGIDQGTKAWAVGHFRDTHADPILGSFIKLRLVYNDGAALSLLGKHTWLISIVMVIIAGLLIWFHGRAQGRLGVLVFGAALGGAFGNLYDRMFVGVGWGKGPVVDMIDYGGLFIGNVADIAIVLAAAATIVASWRGRHIMLPRNAREARGEGAVPAEAGA